MWSYETFHNIWKSPRLGSCLDKLCTWRHEVTWQPRTMRGRNILLVFVVSYADHFPGGSRPQLLFSEAFCSLCESCDSKSEVALMLAFLCSLAQSSKRPGASILHKNSFWIRLFWLCFEVVLSSLGIQSDVWNTDSESKHPLVLSEATA